ncbi:MAG: DUF2089 family protein [Phycisphaerae bacterium]|jgi:hypothetical protein
MENTIPEWAKGLADEDWQFIKRLLLASGSLKDVAEQYGISYPTIRIKLNRLIEKVQILDSKKPKTKFHKTVQLLVIDGKLDISVAKTLLKVFEENTQ